MVLLAGPGFGLRSLVSRDQLYIEPYETGNRAVLRYVVWCSRVLKVEEEIRINLFVILYPLRTCSMLYVFNTLTIVDIGRAAEAAITIPSNFISSIKAPITERDTDIKMPVIRCFHISILPT